MKTIPTKLTNEKQITIHQSEPEEDIFPFNILEETVTINEEGDSVVSYEPIIGNNRISETKYESMTAVVEYIRSKPYDLILALICNAIEAKDAFEKEQQQLQNQKNHENE